MSAETQAEHDCGGPEEECFALFRGEQVAGDVLNPAVRAEFDCTDEGVSHEEHKEHDRTEGELGDHSDTDEQSATDTVANIFGQIRGEADHVFEEAFSEEAEEEAGHGTAEDAHIFEHVAKADALGGSRRLRELLAHEHEAVDHGRDEVERELDAPVDVHLVVKEPADDHANHHPSRPGGVQDVEVMRAVFWEQRGHKRVGHGFESAVGECEDEHTQREHHEGIAAGGGEGHEGGNDVEQERQDDELAVADFIHHDATQDDAEAKAVEAHAADGTELSAGEAELLGPVVKDAAADGEADAGGQDGHEAGPEKSHSIVVAAHRGRCDLLDVWLW